MLQCYNAKNLHSDSNAHLCGSVQLIALWTETAKYTLRKTNMVIAGSSTPALFFGQSVSSALCNQKTTVLHCTKKYYTRCQLIAQCLIKLCFCVIAKSVSSTICSQRTTALHCVEKLRPDATELSMSYVSHVVHFIYKYTYVIQLYQLYIC